MSSSSNSNNNGDDSRYAALKQFSADLERSRNSEPAPEVPYNSDWPVCNSCNRPFFYDEDERKYRCNFCIITVRAADIQFSHHNKNRIYKDLSELAAMSAEQQAQENARINAIRDASATRARLSTQSGANHESGSPAAASNTGGGGSIYQITDIHEHARRINARRDGRYTDHTRTSIREKSTGGGLHPLDVSLQRELGNKVQITKSFEVNNRQPNSPSIVDKSVRRGEHKPYSRYGESANADYKDPYDDDS